MNKIVHLSLARKEVPIRIDVVKGATVPGIDFVLDDYLPESGATARIYIKKRETEVYNDCEISDNVVTFTPTIGSFDEVGECQAQLQIIEGEDVAVSFRMWVDVEENLIDNSAIESSNEYGALIGMTNDINVLKSEVAQIISGASPVDPDEELLDIRIGYDGTTYPTAGDSVRSQVGRLYDEISALPRYRYASEIAETGRGFVSLSGVITPNNNYKYVKYVPKNGASQIKVDSIYVPAYQSSLAVFSFFDSSDTLLGVVSNTDINTGSSQREFTDVVADIPSGTAYLYVTFGRMASSTTFSTIQEYGFFVPETKKRVFNQGLESTWKQQFYFHCLGSDLGDYSSLTFNAKFIMSVVPRTYEVYFVGYDEDYTNREIAIYRTGITKGINGNEITVAENFQDIDHSIKNKHWIGVVLNFQYNESSIASGVWLRAMNEYAVVSEYCMLNDNEIVLAQYPESGYFVTNTEYHAPHNPMLGGFLCAIGDSLTGVYYKSEAESWVSLIASWNNMRFENHGISGNPMAKSDSYEGGKCMAERVDDLDVGKHYTHIMVMGGANDFNLSIPIGENTDTQITTFKGAVNHIIETLTAKFPQAKIVFATTYRRNANYNDKIYADAMLEVCHLHSIPCLNNYENSGVQFFDANWMSKFGAVNALGNNHLNAAGDLFVAPRLEHALKYGIN